MITKDKFESMWTPEPNSGCWLWLGYISPFGYGSMKIDKKTNLAHRISYILFKGDIPEGLDLDHLCRNRACVNPDHLEPVTRSVNLRRGIGLPSKRALQTSCIHGHKFTEENTLKRVGRGENRECRECARERKALYRSMRNNAKFLSSASEASE